jgi:hypothetical protein
MYHVLDYTSARWLISWLSLVEGQPWLYSWLSWLPQSLVDLNQNLNWVKVSYVLLMPPGACSSIRLASMHVQWLCSAQP